MVNITRIKLGSESYPKLLKEIHSPPKQLYVYGVLPDLPHWAAIVGSRKSTPYGKATALHLSSELARAGVVVVSGLAYGIDASAHRGTLDGGGKTVAVLGGGHKHLYPAPHIGLAKEIVDNGGAVVSEYPLDAPPLPQQFAARNRIIAGLCHATVVVEAATKSGSLITATMALEEGREVMAVPGNIDLPSSEGTNNLIKKGAHLISSAEDVLELLGINIGAVKSEMYRPDNEKEASIIDLLKDGVRNGQDILEGSGMSPADFSMTLTTLEIKGIVSAGGANTWHLK